MDRIIALIDMDCFYVQVDHRDKPETWGKPAATIQYIGCGVIAVNYEAREFGVARGMHKNEAKQKCPDIELFQVPERRGKSDLTKYRNASAEVFNVICDYDPKIIVERASIDEAFLDLTEYVNSLDLDTATDDIVSIADVGVEGYQNEGETSMEAFVSAINSSDEECMLERRLLLAAKAVKEIRRRVKIETQFSCSGGVSFNKVLAKLACGIKKPNGQVILPPPGIAGVYDRTLIKKVRNLGGKIGRRIRDYFEIETMGELASYSVEALSMVVEPEIAQWLYALAHGQDDEPVRNRLLARSIGSGKNFPHYLTRLSEVKNWIKQLCNEIVERLCHDQKDNARLAKNLHFFLLFSNGSFIRKTLPITRYDVDVLTDEIVQNALTKVRVNEEQKTDPIVHISLSASNFTDSIEDRSSAVYKTRRIDTYFTRREKPNSQSSSQQRLRSSQPKPSSSSSNPARADLLVDLTDDDTSRSTTNSKKQRPERKEKKRDNGIKKFQAVQKTIDWYFPRRERSNSQQSTISDPCRDMPSTSFYIDPLEELLTDEDLKDPFCFAITNGFFYRKTLELRAKRHQDDSRGTKRPKAH